MKNTLFSVAGMLFGGAALIVSFLPKGPKVAYAETPLLLSEFSVAVQARKEFEKQQAEWDKNLKALNDSLHSTMERMKTGYDKADRARKDSLRAALQQRNEDLQRYTNAVKRMANDKEKELMDPVIKKLNSFLEQWGHDHGFDLILGTLSGGNILQANPEYNVTSLILKDLNEHYHALPLAADNLETHSDSSGKQ